MIAKRGPVEGFQQRLRQCKTGGLDDDGIKLPVERQGYRHVYHQYTVLVEKNRGGVQKRLRELGVGTAVHYPIPVHRQPLYLDLGYDRVSMPVSERVAEQVLSLPVHPGLKDADLTRVVGAVREAVTGA